MFRRKPTEFERAEAAGQIPASAPGLELVNPFDGVFAEPPRQREGGDRLLDFPLARRWRKTLRWGVENDLYTFQQPLEGLSGARVNRAGRSYVMLSSYDYLGLIGHPALTAASVDAVGRYGTGTGGVRLLTGTAQLHRELERTIARFLGAEAALTFSSGYAANSGTLSALLGPRDIVLVDALVHRSITDGCRLSGAQIRSFAHNDLAELRRRLAACPHGARILIVVEGLYSMDGDVCPLPELVALKQEFSALVMVDEAHSFGVLGRTGRGVTEHFGLPADAVDVITGSLSKAIPANGGFVAGRRDFVTYLQHAAAPFFFSAALCPPAAGAAKAAIEVLESEPERIAGLTANANRLRHGLRGLGLDTGTSTGPLIPVITGCDESAYRLARNLLSEGVIATAVVHPAVPRGAARLRLCATAAHSADDIEVALQAFARAHVRQSDAPSTGAARLGGSQVKIHDKISDIEPRLWDTLVAPGDLQASHRFIKLCQDSQIENAAYRHILVYRHGKLAATASLCRMTVKLDLLAPPALRGMAQGARRLFPAFLRLPVLFCGLPTSFGQSCLRFASGADRSMALEILAGLMLELAEELGSELLCLKEFGPRECADLYGLERMGYLRLPSLPYCRLPLKWRSFDAYLADMRAGYRRQARLDHDASQRLGLRVRRLADFGAECKRLHRLYENVLDDTAYRLERLPLAFFENLNAELAGAASALLLERDEEVAAAAILLGTRDTMTFLLAGIDEGANREHHCHPLLVSAVVGEAIRSGVSALELGQAAYGVKARFGAETIPRWVYLRHRTRQWHRLLELGSEWLFPNHEIAQRRVFRTEEVPSTA